MKIHQWITICCVLASTTVTAQTKTELAEAYFKNGDYEKAATEYGRSLRRDVSWPSAWHYVTALKKLNRIEDAQRWIKKQAKNDGLNKPYYTLLDGFLVQTDSARSQSAYQLALEEVQTSSSQSARLAQSFVDIDELSWAIKAYQQARLAATDNQTYSDELIGLYRTTGNMDGWLNELIETAASLNRREAVLNQLAGVVNTKDEAVLERKLYERVQQQPNTTHYNELLSWLFVQKQKFSRALIQEKAIDRRMNLSGARVYELGTVALNNKDYKAAADAFEYVVTTYPAGQFYAFARRMVVNAREEQLKSTYPVDKNDTRKLIIDYRRITQELGTNLKTLESLRSIANLYAYYLDEKDSAMTVLDLAMQVGEGDRQFIDRCKLDKGDIYLLKGEPWESTLLYAQVEKSQKEEPLGYEAKLKNAKLNYYKGDFAAAKDILDILKLATSREIANDAESLSLLIQDNTGLDSTEAALRDYAAVDLLLFQNKTDQVIHELGRLSTKYANHSLADEILWLRANTYLKQGNIEVALADLNRIDTEFSNDILGDDALFLQAKIQEEQKKDKEVAMKLYQKLLTTYPSSIFGAEARKRFRTLRGDALN